MSKFLKVFVLFLLFLFLIITTVSIFSAAKKSNLPVITVLCWDRGIIPQDQGTIEDNWWTRFVNEKVAKLGFQVKFIPIPRAQELQKLPTMLAAGEAPDICFSYDKGLYGVYLKNKALLDYTDLIKKYGKNIVKQFSADDLALGKSNGRIYSIVYRSVATADTTWVRKDWLDKIGMKPPTNPTEFYNMLKAFKEKDPGKVGDKLIPFAFPSGRNYPFGIWWSTVLPGFLKEAPSPEKRHEILYPLWPETKDCLRFLNKLYNEKLLADDFLLDKDETIFRQRITRGELGSMVEFAHYPYHSAYGNLEENLQKNIPDAQYISIFPWKNDASKENLIEIVRGYPFGYFFFSPVTAKHPDLVVKYLDWLASDEANWTAWFGIEGTDYKMVDGIPMPIDDAKYKARVPWIGSQYNTLRNPFVNLPETYIKRQAMDFNVKYREQFIKETIAGSKKIKYYQPWITEATPLLDKYTAPLQKKWEDLQTKIITAPIADFDSIYDQGIKEYKREGGDEVAKEFADAYKKQYGQGKTKK